MAQKSGIFFDKLTALPKNAGLSQLSLLEITKGREEGYGELEGYHLRSLGILDGFEGSGFPETPPSRAREGEVGG
jgi:hypothetical protein